MKTVTVEVTCNVTQATRIAIRVFKDNRRTTEVMVQAYNANYVFKYQGKRDEQNIIKGLSLLRTINK